MRRHFPSPSSQLWKVFKILRLLKISNFYYKNFFLAKFISPSHPTISSPLKLRLQKNLSQLPPPPPTHKEQAPRLEVKFQSRNFLCQLSTLCSIQDIVSTLCCCKINTNGLRTVFTLQFLNGRIFNIIGRIFKVSLPF